MRPDAHAAKDQICPDIDGVISGQVCAETRIWDEKEDKRQI